MRMRSGLVAVSLVLLGPVPGRAEPPPPQFMPKSTSQQPHRSGVPRAAHVEKLPTAIELKVGTKASYEGVQYAGIWDPTVATISLEGTVLTVLAVKPGRTTLTAYKATKGRAPPDADAVKGAPKIPVRVIQ